MPTIYDAHGRPVDLSALKHEVAGPSIFGVRPVVSGHPAQGLMPERLAGILRQAENGDPLSYFELAEDMEEKDLHYRSVLSTRKNQVAGLQVTMEAAGNDAQSVKQADMLREWLQRDELQQELFDIMDAVGKGLSLVEINWDTSGKQWLPANLTWRDPRWFVFNREDGCTPLVRTDMGPQALPPYKFIVHKHKSKSGLPIRGGLARAVAWSYLFKNFDIKSWVQFAEAYGIPFRVGKYGSGASQKDKDTLLEAVSSIASDAAAIIPATMAIEFVEAKVSGNLDLFERLAAFLDRQVSKAVLGQTGTTDTGQHVGTANAHERVREDIELADSVQLSATLNRDLVRPIIDLNFGPQRVYPRLRVFRPDAEDLQQLADSLVKLVPLGLRVEESVVRDRFGLPDPAPDAQLLAAPASTSADRAAAPAVSTVARHSVQTTPRLDAIDHAVADELNDWRPLVAPLVAPIQQLLKDCLARGDSLEDFQRLLEDLPAKQDVAPMAAHLATQTTRARLHGLSGLSLDDSQD